MPRKINPKSFRLGLFQVWNNTLQIYGKNLSLYNQLFYTKLLVENYIACLSNYDKGIFINISKWFLNVNTATLLVNFINVDPLHFKTVYLDRLYENLKFLKTLNLKFYLVRHFSWLNTSSFISSYIKYSFNKNKNFKDILKEVIKLLFFQVSSKKFFYNNKGVTLLKLTGFKLEVSGCFGSNKSQMSKVLKYTKGKISLLKLNSYVEYDCIQIYSKSGINSFKVWLLYTEKN
uniref:Ribosomal protein S3 n=1 Tax=Kumanoa ambigua TaxID=644273 RepID=A0A343UXU7_9FLOR|nr:ribosomal protein S3 [Kumanoa ambigua]AVK39504.1 ribosomal protein S3 [Kumanoa ambigua]